MPDGTSDLLKYVKKNFHEGELDIPATIIDQAHQIGPEYSDYKPKRKCKVIIISFIAIRHRTLM